MQKKETYATTGTRITVRFFGGWDYGEAVRGLPIGLPRPTSTGSRADRLITLSHTHANS